MAWDWDFLSVFSTCVEVILNCVFFIFIINSILHIRGGDPSGDRSWLGPYACSLQVWSFNKKSD